MVKKYESRSLGGATFDGPFSGPNWQELNVQTGEPVFPGGQIFGHSNVGRRVIGLGGDSLGVAVGDYQEPDYGDYFGQDVLESGEPDLDALDEDGDGLLEAAASPSDELAAEIVSSLAAGRKHHADINVLYEGTTDGDDTPDFLSGFEIKARP